MCLAQGPQCSEAGEARTCGPSVSSQALYHWATALPKFVNVHILLIKPLFRWICIYPFWKKVCDLIRFSNLIKNSCIHVECCRLAGWKLKRSVVYNKGPGSLTVEVRKKCCSSPNPAMKWADPEGGTGGSDLPPGKSQLAIEFLRNYVRYHPREAIGPIGSNCFLRKSIQPSAKYVDN